MLDPRCLHFWTISGARSLEKRMTCLCSLLILYIYIYIFDHVPDHGVEDLMANIV